MSRRRLMLDAASVWVAVDGGQAFEAVRENPTRWYADDPNVNGPLGIPLTDGVAVDVSVSSKDALGNVLGTVAQTVTWEATDLAGKSYSSDSITIRKGDALLLTATDSGETLQIDPDGTGFVTVPGGPGQPLEATYGTAGEFIAEAKITYGGVTTSVGTMLITVVDVDLHGPIACQVGFTREKSVTVTPVAALDKPDHVVFVPADLALLEVTVAALNDDGATLHLSAAARGTPVLTARIGGETGPIVAYREVNEFTLDVPARCCFIIDDDKDAGKSNLTMHPYLPDLELTFNMFGSQSTFIGGETFFTINTSDAESSLGELGFQQVLDESTGETVGEFLYTVEVPEGEDMICMNLDVLQTASPGVPVGESHGVNGNACVVDVLPVTFRHNDPRAPRPLVVKVETAGGQPHKVVIVNSQGLPDNEARFVQGTPPDTRTTSNGDVPCPQGGELEELTIGGKGENAAGQPTLRLYHVKIGDTTFDERIVVVPDGREDLFMLYQLRVKFINLWRKSCTPTNKEHGGVVSKDANGDYHFYELQNQVPPNLQDGLWVGEFYIDQLTGNIWDDRDGDGQSSAPDVDLGPFEGTLGSVQNVHTHPLPNNNADGPSLFDQEQAELDLNQNGMAGIHNVIEDNTGTAGPERLAREGDGVYRYDASMHEPIDGQPYPALPQQPIDPDNPPPQFQPVVGPEFIPDPPQQRP